MLLKHAVITRTHTHTHTNSHSFAENKSQHWMKPGSKLSFHFVDILKLKFFFTEGILNISISHINQKNTVNRLSTCFGEENVINRTNGI